MNESDDIFSASSSAVFGTTSGRPVVRLQGDQVVAVSPDDSTQELAYVPVDVAYEKIAETATLVRQQLAEIYKQHRQQSQNWFRASVVAASAGFLVVAIGAIMALAGYSTGSLISIVAGIIPEIVAALFYKQASQASRQLQSDQQKLIDTERIHQAVELIFTIEDTQLRNELKAAIIQLTLQHGASS